jgi:hypothetical protein
MILVVTDVSWVAIEALSHLEDTSRLAKFSPEVLGYFWNSIDSNTVEVISLN